MMQHSRRSFLTLLLAALLAALLTWLGGKKQASAKTPASGRRRPAEPWPGRVTRAYDRYGRLTRTVYYDPLPEPPFQVVYDPVPQPPSQVVHDPAGPDLCDDARLGQFSYRCDAIPSSFDLPPGPANS